MTEEEKAKAQFWKSREYVQKLPRILCMISEVLRWTNPENEYVVVSRVFPRAFDTLPCQRKITVIIQWNKQARIIQVRNLFFMSELRWIQLVRRNRVDGSGPAQTDLLTNLLDEFAS